MGQIDQIGEHAQSAGVGAAIKGRGAVSNRSDRFSRYQYEADPVPVPVPIGDGMDVGSAGGAAPPPKTSVTDEIARHIITKNSSPDVSFDHSINVYRGCEHGCIYCFARPTHGYLGLSSGLDFETKLFAKPQAAALLREAFSKPGYRPKRIAIGTNTDPYQPIEKSREIMRQLLEVFIEARHPVSILTKSRLVIRDIDLLADLAKDNLVKVGLSVTTLDVGLSRKLEPRAASPQRRLDAIRLLSDAGIPTMVMAAPVIPAINDHEIETILAAAAHAGARGAGYILLRLPGEVKQLFEEWLDAHFPDRKNRVMRRLMAMRGGRANDPRFGSRMRGSGVEANLLNHRFKRAALKAGLNEEECLLNHSLFRPPEQARQLSLFG